MCLLARHARRDGGGGDRVAVGSPSSLFHAASRVSVCCASFPALKRPLQAFDSARSTLRARGVLRHAQLTLAKQAGIQVGIAA